MHGRGPRLAGRATQSAAHRNGSSSGSSPRGWRWIVDLGSTNGTLVNGDPIQEKQLSHGDRVTIGQNAVHFSLVGS